MVTMSVGWVIIDLCTDNTSNTVDWVLLPRCMEYRRGVPMYRWEFCPSVRLSNACIVTKQKKDLSRFLYHTKDHLA